VREVTRPRAGYGVAPPRGSPSRPGRPDRPGSRSTLLNKTSPHGRTIAGILALDGLTNGAIYALLALATVLVFAVTRVIFIPQGEFVAFGALTLALLQAGKVPGTVWFLLVLAARWRWPTWWHGWRHRQPLPRLLAGAGARTLAWPVAVSLLAIWAAPRGLPLLAQAALTVALVTPFGR
jgi:branched-chain amino acid transport system permease protein